jgi:hypothetical protein
MARDMDSRHPSRSSKISPDIVTCLLISITNRPFVYSNNLIVIFSLLKVSGGAEMKIAGLAAGDQRLQALMDTALGDGPPGVRTALGPSGSVTVS